MLNQRCSFTAYLAVKYGHHPLLLPTSCKSLCTQHNGYTMVDNETD